MADPNDTLSSKAAPKQTIQDRFDQGKQKADELRLRGIQGLNQALLARQASLQEEQARLAAIGRKDSPLAAGLAAQAQTLSGYLGDMQTHITRAQTPSVKADPKTWALQGYVWNGQDHSPAPGLTVALYDAAGAWQRALGFGCTDAKGYFQISPKEMGAAGAELSQEGRKPVYIHVQNKNNQTLYRGSEPLALKAGQVFYQEIFLSKETGSVCNPPAERSRDSDDDRSEKQSVERKAENKETPTSPPAPTTQEPGGMQSPPKAKRKDRNKGKPK